MNSSRGSVGPPALTELPLVVLLMFTAIAEASSSYIRTGADGRSWRSVTNWWAVACWLVARAFGVSVWRVVVVVFVPCVSSPPTPNQRIVRFSFQIQLAAERPAGIVLNPRAN